MASLTEADAVYNRYPALRTDGIMLGSVADVILRLEAERDQIAQAAEQGIAALNDALVLAGTRMQRAEAERDAYRRVIEVLSRAGDLDSVRGVAWAALAKIGAGVNEDRAFVNSHEEIEDDDGNTRPMTPAERRAWEQR